MVVPIEHVLVINVLPHVSLLATILHIKKALFILFPICFFLCSSDRIISIHLPLNSIILFSEDCNLVLSPSSEIFHVLLLLDFIFVYFLWVLISPLMFPVSLFLMNMFLFMLFKHSRVALLSVNSYIWVTLDSVYMDCISHISMGLNFLYFMCLIIFNVC